MGGFWKRLWDDVRPNLVWEIVKLLVAGLIVTGVIAWLRAIAEKPISATTAGLIFGGSCVVLAIAICLRYRSKAVSGEPRRGKRRMANSVLIYLPILIGLVFCVWAYIVGKKVFQMSDDVGLLQARMVRYVLPRSLTAEQKTSIAEYLSKHEPQPVVMKVVQDDEEASSYRADLQQALERGGWPVASITYDAALSEGLSIRQTEPMRQPGQEDPFDRLRPKKKPIDILGEAFRQARVIADSAGTGTGVNITTTAITISIGHRRRDKWAIPPPPRKEGRQLPEDPDQEN